MSEEEKKGGRIARDGNGGQKNITQITKITNTNISRMAKVTTDSENVAN